MDATAAPERVSSVLRRVGWGAGRETAREKSRRQDVGGRTRTVEHVGTLLRSRPDRGQLQLRRGHLVVDSVGFGADCSVLRWSSGR